MARKKQTEPVTAIETTEVTDNLQIDEVMLETEVLDEVIEQEAVIEQPRNPLEMAITNHGRRYWDMVNKQWIDTGYNFVIFDDEIKKTKLINNLTQVNILAGYNRFEWVA